MTPLGQRIETSIKWWQERVGKSEVVLPPIAGGFAVLRSVVVVLVVIQMISGILLSLNYTPSSQPLTDSKGTALAPYLVSRDVIDADGDTVFRAKDNVLLPVDSQTKTFSYPGKDSTAFSVWTKHENVILEPSAAWISVEYTNSNQRALGIYIRTIHSLCAHLCIALCLLYIIAGCLLRIYRAPRELVWMASVCLLLLLFASAWSGSVLPWNQRSFASLAIVVSSIEQYMPLIGEKVAFFLRSGNTISTATLPRMFVVHSIVCPLLLIGVYRFIRRSKAGTGLSRYSIAAIVIVVLLLSWIVGARLLPSGGQWLPYDASHPIQTSMALKPEWYFLDAYYMLKEFPGDAAALLLGASILLYLFLPFIEKRFRKGIIIKSVVWLVTATLLYCFIRGIMM